MVIVWSEVKKLITNFLTYLCHVGKSLGFTVWILMTQPDNVPQRLLQNLLEIFLSTTDLSIHEIKQDCKISMSRLRQ